MIFLQKKSTSAARRKVGDILVLIISYYLFIEFISNNISGIYVTCVASHIFNKFDLSSISKGS